MSTIWECATQSRHDAALATYRRLGLRPVMGGSGEGDPAATPPPATEPPKPEADDDKLGEAGQAALKSERDARKAAERQMRDLEKQLADLTKAQKDRDDEEARKKGEWEKLAKDRETELADLKAKLAAQDRQAWRLKAAAKHGIPDELVNRISGDTEADMDDDAKALAKHLTGKAAPETDAGKQTAKASGKPDPNRYQDFAKWGIRHAG